MTRTFAALLILIALLPAPSAAQEPPPVPSSATEPQGFVREPDPVLRIVLFADRHLGKGELNNGFYINQPNMVPGAGWLAAGPGYRQWYVNDKVFTDAAAAISWNGFKMANGRVEVPGLLKSRLLVGTEMRWLDFTNIDYFGANKTEHADYKIQSAEVAAYATLRPVQWMGVGALVGWMNPAARQLSGPLTLPTPDQRQFVPVEAAFVIDVRDFPGHPTRGALIRTGIAHYDDRTDGTASFRRYDGEFAGFVPVAGGRVVLATHGWVVSTNPDEGRSVPFYLQPSLGGANTLRSYVDFRFHDRNMVAANAEVRVALMTHMDVAMFADAGNVAHRFEDLNFDRRSYGAGVRFHTRRDTFALVDVARGDEGWRVLFRMSDPFQLQRVQRRTVPVPFVP